MSRSYAPRSAARGALVARRLAGVALLVAGRVGRIGVVGAASGALFVPAAALGGLLLGLLVADAHLAGIVLGHCAVVAHGLKVPAGRRIRARAGADPRGFDQRTRTGRSTVSRSAPWANTSSSR